MLRPTTAPSCRRSGEGVCAPTGNHALCGSCRRSGEGVCVLRPTTAPCAGLVGEMCRTSNIKMYMITLLVIVLLCIAQKNQVCTI